METQQLQTFKALYKPHSRLLGIDLGDKTIGLAVSDGSWMIANPLKTLPRTKLVQDILVLKKVIQDNDVVGLVMGLPINMDGTSGARVQATQDYARELIKYLDMPLLFWDERLTTVMAERVLLEADMSRKRRGEVIDKMAAALILQGVLDRLAYLSSGRPNADPA